MFGVLLVGAGINCRVLMFGVLLDGAIQSILNHSHIVVLILDYVSCLMHSFIIHYCSY